ncbi:ionotropic receptor 93a-like [Procambarus clarkii]|uniref:ionotropic receptor 93a-like n=1 Tax=Procambarus clarkii TaxID=6728 RepID=UPI003741FB70
MNLEPAIYCRYVDHIFTNVPDVRLLQELKEAFEQNVFERGGDRWWERVVVVVWGLVTVVLTQSYAGNLMALLAVRHIPQPYQSILDVVEDKSAIMILEHGSSNAQFKKVETGIYREIAVLQEKGRLLYVPPSQFAEIIDTLVRRGDHVTIQTDSDIRIYMSRDFSASDQCYFYESKEEYEPLMLAMVSQKGNPIVSSMSKRIQAMTEAGLFQHWMMAAEPNYTACYHAPTIVTVQESLSLSNVWGMFVILIAGHAISVHVLCLELVIGNILH